jgi:hypothetical protein
VSRDDQPDAREGQAGRVGVAERLTFCTSVAEYWLTQIAQSFRPVSLRCIPAFQLVAWLAVYGRPWPWSSLPTQTSYLLPRGTWQFFGLSPAESRLAVALLAGKKRWLGRPDHDLFAENARVNGFQDDSRCDAIEETENSLAGVWDTEAFLYAFEVETPQIISRAAHALPDGKCFSLGTPPGQSTGDPSSPLSLPGMADFCCAAGQQYADVTTFPDSATRRYPNRGTEQQEANERIHQLRSEAKSLRAIPAILAADGVILSHQGIKNVL